MYSPSVSSSPGEARAPSLLVVCGLSGAGKSTVLQVLEDLDFFTADGLPPSLIPECCRMFSRPGMEHFRGMALVLWISGAEWHGQGYPRRRPEQHGKAPSP